MTKPYRILEFDELDSTNRYCISKLRELSHGDVVVAKTQTAGRGRWGRAWISAIPGNLSMSIVIKPEPEMEERVIVLAHLVAVCLCRVLERLGVEAKIKWPNDVLVDGLKLAGILAESATYGSKFAGMVAGIGVNLNLDPAALKQIDKPATALNLLLGKEVEVAKFRDALLDEFFAAYDPFMRTGFSSVRHEYLQRSAFIGRPIEVKHQDLVVRGTALDVDDEGALRVQTAGGAVQTVSIGEMFAA